MQIALIILAASYLRLSHSRVAGDATESLLAVRNLLEDDETKNVLLGPSEHESIIQKIRRQLNPGTQTQPARPAATTQVAETVGVDAGTVGFDAGKDHFEIGLPSCLDDTLVIGPWTSRGGNQYPGATVGGIRSDIRLVKRSAKSGFGDAAAINLVKKNAQATCDYALDVLNNQMLCPAAQASHTELRRLLLDNGNRYRANIYKSTILAGAAIGAGAVGKANITTTNYLLTIGTIAWVSNFVCGEVDHLAELGRLTDLEALAFGFVASLMRGLAERASLKWGDIKRSAAAQAIQCASFLQASDSIAALPGATDNQLGLDGGAGAQIPAQGGQDLASGNACGV